MVIVVVCMYVEEHAEGRRQSKCSCTADEEGHLAQRRQEPAPKRPTGRGWAINFWQWGVGDAALGPGQWKLGKQLSRLIHPVVGLCVAPHGV